MVVDLGFGELFVINDDDFADVELGVFQRLTKRDDLFRHDDRSRDRVSRQVLAALDAFRDHDLALSGEKRHRPHLSQVHAYRIVRFVERTGREVELNASALFAHAGETGGLHLLVLLFGFDDVDTGVAEHVEELIQLLRRADLRGQVLVDLVVKEVAFFLAQRDEGFDLIVFLFDRGSADPGLRHALVSTLPSVSMRRANDRISAVRLSSSAPWSSWALRRDSCRLRRSLRSPFRQSRALCRGPSGEGSVMMRVRCFLSASGSSRSRRPVGTERSRYFFFLHCPLQSGLS